MKFKRLTFKKGFTLIEVLVSLFVLSLFMHSLMLIYDSYHRIETEIRTDYSADFLHFMALLELELANYEVKEVLPEQVTLKNKVSGYNNYLIHQNEKIYISPGHQPLSYNIQEWQIVQVHKKLYVTVIYTNGQSFSGIISIKLVEELNCES